MSGLSISLHGGLHCAAPIYRCGVPVAEPSGKIIPFTALNTLMTSAVCCKNSHFMPDIDHRQQEYVISTEPVGKSEAKKTA